MKIAIILLMAVAIAYMADRLAREENQRFALMTGACAPPAEPASAPSADPCLAAVQSRPSWAWHLYEALTAPRPPVRLTSPD